MNRIHLLAFVIAVALAAIAFCLYFVLMNSPADGNTGKIELSQKVNPNKAATESLMRLPGISRKRAQAIIAYREQFRNSGKGDLAFSDCNDLQNIKGIGPGVTDDMCQYLEFNGD
jgi:competence ComEA-like helix-hairpin-helix protein